MLPLLVCVLCSATATLILLSCCMKPKKKQEDGPKPTAKLDMAKDKQSISTESVDDKDSTAKTSVKDASERTQPSISPHKSEEDTPKAREIKKGREVGAKEKGYATLEGVISDWEQTTAGSKANKVSQPIKATKVPQGDKIEKSSPKLEKQQEVEKQEDKSDVKQNSEAMLW